jgi:hypothetical protein
MRQRSMDSCYTGSSVLLTAAAAVAVAAAIAAAAL